MINQIKKLDVQLSTVSEKINKSISKLDEKISKLVNNFTNFLSIANQPIEQSLKEKKLTKESGRDDEVCVECCFQLINICCCCCEILLSPRQPAVYVRIA